MTSTTPTVVSVVLCWLYSIGYVVLVVLYRLYCISCIVLVVLYWLYCIVIRNIGCSVLVGELGRLVDARLALLLSIA